MVRRVQRIILEVSRLFWAFGDFRPLEAAAVLDSREKPKLFSLAKNSVEVREKGESKK